MSKDETALTPAKSRTSPGRGRRTKRELRPGREENREEPRPRARELTGPPLRTAASAPTQFAGEADAEATELQGGDESYKVRREIETPEEGVQLIGPQGAGRPEGVAGLR